MGQLNLGATLLTMTHGAAALAAITLKNGHEWLIRGGCCWQIRAARAEIWFRFCVWQVAYFKNVGEVRPVAFGCCLAVPIFPVALA